MPKPAGVPRTEPPLLPYPVPTPLTIDYRCQAGEKAGVSGPSTGCLSCSGEECVSPLGYLNSSRSQHLWRSKF
eukprot:scaffold9107_cov112-Isochrysis_galbana.AAC.10